MKKTYLNILRGILCGRGKKVFPNQVVFYNCIFGITNPTIVSSEYIEKVFRKCLSGGQLPDREGQTLARQFSYLLQSALDSNSANVGKHINNDAHMPIPRHHKVHYSDEGSRTEIVWRIQAGIGFLDKIGRSGDESMDEADYDALLSALKSGLPGSSYILEHTATLDAGVLSNIIYEVVTYHLARLDEPGYDAAESRLQVDAEAQRQEYERKAECFGSLNIDRYYAIRRMAETNVWAAHELANLYFHGFAFREINEGSGNNGIYRVEVNHGLAMHYYQKGADCDPPLLPACWSLGYMIWNGMAEGLTEEEAERTARKYFTRCMEEDYIPAFNSIGNIELARGRALLKRQEEREAGGSGLSGEEREEMYACFRLAMKYFDYAGCNGWPYGHINMAETLADDSIRTKILPHIQNGLQLQGSLDVKERWQAAADYGNLWAIDQLGLVYLKEGDWERACSLWREASERNYPSSGLNMALYIYGPEGTCPDTLQYISCLERASVDGSARASYELARYSVKRNTETCYKYLRIAQRQNYTKYNDELHQAIKAMMNSLEGSEQPH